MTNTAESEEDKKRARQQERTVDNLNRLFAMLFSIVFSMAASYETLKIISFSNKALTKTVAIDYQTIFFNAGALLTLAVTSAVFFHQASRGLDLAYSSSSLSDPRPGALALDFGIVTATMVPFVLMARALDGDVTRSTGFFMFFLAHESLILFGLILLIVGLFRLRYFPAETVNPAYERVSPGVQRFWFAMNSLYIFITALFFAMFSGSFDNTSSCPLVPNRGSSFLFMASFFTLAIARNVIDYFSLFKVFFPVKPESVGATPRFPAVLSVCPKTY